MTELLTAYPLTHAGLAPFVHPRLGVETNAQTVVRYLRFLKPARLERLELPYAVYGRWVPDVPTHPAHLLISILDPVSHTWKLVREIHLPPDPRLLGEGLSQEMSMAEMNAHFQQVLTSPPRVIELDGLVTDHLRVECDREHPVWPSHGECNGGPYNVPFGLLDPLRAYGEWVVGPDPQPVYSPGLNRAGYNPVAPAGMHVYEKMGVLYFESPRLKVGFSLRRPLLMYLGWDAAASGPKVASQAQSFSQSNDFGPPSIPGLSPANRLGLTQSNFQHPFGLIGGLSGPLLRGLQGEYGAQLWTGEIEVVGSQVAYRRLTCGAEGLEIDAIFTVEADRLILELRQTCVQPLPVLEWEAWRLLFDLRSGMTAPAAQPTLLPGRNGDVHFPILWASDGAGCLALSLLEGDARLQVESYRSAYCVTGGILLAPRPQPGECLVIPAGERSAVIELAVTNLEPESEAINLLEVDNLPGVKDLQQVFQRHWASVYSCFRPEYGGFSNHAAAVNCHVNQHGPLDIVAHTRRHPAGLDPLDLMRFTLKRALLDGGGYGYYRSLYQDSDPVLVSAAGRIYQVSADLAWLRQVEPGLLEAIQRIAGAIGEDGLVLSHDLTGNSGSYRWSTNAMDVVGFGHIDGYVNAWSYRALRSAAPMLAALGRSELATHCRELALGIRRAFAGALLNPQTGWIAGWRSRDGQLHDYAFLWVNAPAIAFGLLEDAQARVALAGLEALREKVGPGSAWYGIPHNLLPIDPRDHMLPLILGRLVPTFERYTDGALGAYNLNHYIRALSLYGFRAQARKLADEFSEGLLAGSVIGGMGSGTEFHTWEGLPSGYEGTFGPSFAALYAIAIEYGLYRPLSPEWWPAGG
jgi:hypothetical protein